MYCCARDHPRGRIGAGAGAGSGAGSGDRGSAGSDDRGDCNGGSVSDDGRARGSNESTRCGTANCGTIGSIGGVTSVGLNVVDSPGVGATGVCIIEDSRFELDAI